MYKFKKTDGLASHMVKEPDDLYNFIEDATGDEALAVEVCGWAENKDYGDCFEHELFTVEILEE